MIFKLNLKNFKNLIFRRENILILLIVTIIFFFDRIVKNFVLQNVNEKFYFVNKFINIDLIWNIGIGFGLFSTDTTLIYSFITFLIGSVIIALIYVLILSQYTDKLIYSLIIGGALGNFYDRLTFKAVPDFIDLHYNNFHWFTFNIADIFITIGVIIFILRGFIFKN